MGSQRVGHNLVTKPPPPREVGRAEVKKETALEHPFPGGRVPGCTRNACSGQLHPSGTHGLAYSPEKIP